MQIIITRTSTNGHADDDGNPIPPHPRATRVSFPSWDCRTFKTEEDFDASFAHHPSEGPWYSRGTQHTRWSRGICRILGEELHWTVTLEPSELLPFIESVGRCVLTPPPSRPKPYEIPLWTLEIYDSLRE